MYFVAIIFILSAIGLAIYVLTMSRWSKLYEAGVEAGGTREGRRLILWVAVIAGILALIRILAYQFR